VGVALRGGTNKQRLGQKPEVAETTTKSSRCHFHFHFPLFSLYARCFHVLAINLHAKPFWSLNAEKAIPAFPWPVEKLAATP